MSSKTKADLCFTIPFDHTLFVDPSLVNYKKEIQLGDVPIRIEFPGEKEKNSRGLKPPKSSPKGITKHLPEKHWGIMKEGHKYISIEACLIVVPTEAEIHFELTEEQVGGKEVEEYINKISEWFNSFTYWIWALTGQSLNSVYPDPKVIHRKSRDIIITLSVSEKSSIPRIQPPPFEISFIKDGQLSEQIVNDKILNLAVESAGTHIPLPLELLTSARMAARRGDRRRALSDAGTAVELVLTDILALDENHRHTLKPIVKEARKKGIKIPKDTEGNLIYPRNDAMHRGEISKPFSIERALEITEEIVSLSVSELIPFSSLTPVFRPYRQNMNIIIPE